MICSHHLFLRSRLAAKLFPFKKPAVLLLSSPRSGSSWIGTILSRSPELAYLREPVNQGYQSRFKRGPESVVDPESDEVIQRIYAQLADDAFIGIPAREMSSVIDSPEDFGLSRRLSKRLLIKEINPLAAAFYVRRYAPRVIILLRHPAAVAESYERLGWLGGMFKEFGRDYGASLKTAIDAVKDSKNTIVRYEDLARHPLDQFGQLFQAAEIKAPANLPQIVHEFCEKPRASADPYEIRRTSKDETDKWRTKLKPAMIDAVRTGFRRSGLNYYLDDSEW